MVSYDLAFKVFIQQAFTNHIYKQSLIELVKLFICLKKAKGKFLYSAVSGPRNCAKGFYTLLP